jgi:hypothetical protein
MFPVYDGKCFSRKAVNNWVEKFSQGRSKVSDEARPSTEVVEATDERRACCGFRRPGKVMGQEYQYCCIACREINVFSRLEYHMFPFYIHL